MSLQSFNIVFDNPNGTYYAGQQVTGRIFIHTTKEKKIRGICIRLKGEAEVKWTESRQVTHDGKSHTEYDDYRAHELYVYTESWLIGSSHGEMKLPPGKHVYPFSCSLPINVPSSFEGSRGHVRYTVKVKIDRPWKFDHEAKVAFTVLSSLDLNMEGNMLEPTQLTREKFLCCCCCRSGPITVVVNVLRGFVPGQRIEAIIECDNITRKEVSVKCYLEKTVKFHARHGGHTKTKRDDDMVAVERLGTVGANGSMTWTSKLEVPSLPASYLKHCNCIDISYSFVVKAVIPGLHNDFNISVPVVIGTIPLRNYFPSIIPSAPCAPGIQPPPPFEDVIGIPSAPPYDFVAPYPEMPPPSYEEYMLAKGNIRNEEDNDYVFGATEFAPRYPMYSFR